MHIIDMAVFNQVRLLRLKKTLYFVDMELDKTCQTKKKKDMHLFGKSEAGVYRCFWIWVFLKISENLRENICAGVSFL